MRYIFVLLALYCAAFSTATVAAFYPRPLNSHAPSPAPSASPAAPDYEEHNDDDVRPRSGAAVLTYRGRWANCRPPEEIVSGYAPLQGVSIQGVAVAAGSVVRLTTQRTTRCRAGTPPEKWKPGVDRAYYLGTKDRDSGVAVWVHEDR